MYCRRERCYGTELQIRENEPCIFSAEDTPAQQYQINLALRSLIRTLALPKILTLGKNASKLAFFSRLIRISDFVEDTPARQSPNKLDIALAYSNFGCAEDTPARQSPNKLDIALAYSHFGSAEDTPARQSPNKFGIALAYSYLCPIWNGLQYSRGRSIPSPADTQHWSTRP